jgi:energy-coupling factor transporter ATP-binding protein EcfA2
MLEMTGTSRLAEQKPETLSEGEKRRTVLAQVLATFPRLLILDEPFSGLDAEGKKLLWKQTRSWIESAKTPTILITHDALEAEMFTEKVHLYRAGELRILS